MNGIFVDTNILVYARDLDHGRKQQAAAECLNMLWRERTGRTSIQVLSEYYVTVTRKLKPGIKAEDAWDDVQALMSWEPQPIDAEVLERAREIERRYRTGWRDAAIVAAAQAQSCSVLLSEDFQDGMLFGQLTVRNPFASRVEQSHAEYRVALMPRPRHRARGRPAGAA
ncbi:MAG: PIN domain-containing protein [Steroidobacteraceae bacterium]|jgi:predicted nucleic acid-binding protein